MFTFKFLLPSFFLIASCSFVFAQDIDKIKRDAERNKELERESLKENLSVSNSDVNAIVECFRLLGYLFQTVGVVHMEMLEKEENVPEMSSLECIADANISGRGAYEFRPRVRGNWGLFSTDARFYTIAAKNHEEKFDQLTYFDWQVLMLNLAAKRNFKWRLGTGFSHEYYTGNNYNEHSTQLEVLPIKKFWMKVEGRFAKDYKTKTIVCKEANIAMEYCLKEKTHHAIFVGINAAYNKLYATNPFWVFGPSLRIRLQ